MKIRELLTDKNKWIKHNDAVDIKGRVVASKSSEAIRWCLFGAIQKCYPNKKGIKIMNMLYSEIKCDSIKLWNDKPSTTFRKVKTLVEKLDV